MKTWHIGVLSALVLGIVWYLIRVDIKILIVICITIYASIVQIPTAHYGLGVIFGKRGRAVKEGLHLRIPFIEGFLLFSAKTKTYKFVDEEIIVVSTADNLGIVMEGSVQGLPEFKELAKFAGIPEDTIENGMRDAVEGALGIVAGKSKGEDFIGQRESIEQLINCLLRLPRRPDFYIKKDDPEDFTRNPQQAWQDYLTNAKLANPKDALKIDEKLKTSAWVLPIIPETGELDTLQFYSKNVTRIALMLDLESSMNESSHIEDLYAFHIVTFKVSKINFSDDVKKAFEKDVIATKELKAAEHRQEMKMQIMLKLISAGVSPDQASDDADAAVGIAPKQTIKGGIPLVNVK